jgi:hypothetical protein
LTEEFLLTIDEKMFRSRTNLVRLLKYVGGGIDDRETHIKEALLGIAVAEMKKGIDEDLLFQETLKTI